MPASIWDDRSGLHATLDITGFAMRVKAFHTFALHSSVSHPLIRCTLDHAKSGGGIPLSYGWDSSRLGRWVTFAPFDPRASTFHDGLGDCRQGATRCTPHRAHCHGGRRKSLTATFVLFYSTHSSTLFNESIKLTWRNRRLPSPTRVNLEEPVRVASPTKINLKEPISSGYPAQPGLTWRNPSGWPAQPELTWRNPAGLPSTTRINLTLCPSSVFCTLIHMWRCCINCSYYSYVKKNRKVTNKDL